MKRLFYLFTILYSFPLYSQIECTVQPADTLICFRDSIAFIATATGERPFQYSWQKNLVTIPGATDSIFGLGHALESDTGTYRCIVTNASDTAISNDATLHMYPPMKFDTLYRYNSLGCRGECKGQFKTLVSGGAPPYSYEWGGGHSQDTIVFGLCMGNYRLKVYDTNQCMIDSGYYVDVLKSPKFEFKSYLKDLSNPKDSFYLTNPNVIVAFPTEYTDSIINWEWDFGDESATIPNVNPAGHTYEKTGMFTILLNVTDLNGCDTTITHDISVKVAELEIPYAFSPNGDQKNETFMIRIKGLADVDFREAYLGNELLVWDRWGRKIYSKTDYQSGDWDGGNAPDGVYFFILKCKGQYSDEVFKGSVTILRGH